MQIPNRLFRARRMSSLGFDRFVTRFRRRRILVRDASGKQYWAEKKVRPTRREAVGAAVIEVWKTIGRAVPAEYQVSGG